MKRLFSLLLTFCLTASLLPAQVQAAENASSGGLDRLGIRQISEKEYAMTPDVKEYEWILNNGALTQQMMGHVMEVKVGEGSTASIAAGYSDDDIDTIKTGRNWAMTETTKQAQSMQSRRNINVVGAINAGGYDMSNGRPSGAFIMSGTQINAPTGTTFWIDKSGDAHITSAQECNAAYAAGNVLEAVASFGDIFENGHARSGLDNVTRASRTAIGIKADGSVVMFMVDGRQAPYSVGMTMAEVAAAMEDLGCVHAINLDGGGSSTFATQREGEQENSTAGLTLRCRPSDGYERKVSNTIMVLSTAQPTGQFDHAVVTPNDEVYTPGSTVQFKATGIDAAGGKAEIPTGASWAILSGNGSIDANGLYTAAGTCDEVKVGLKVGGQIIGQTKIQVQWPDKLGFTNNSVSIDFGKTSDLTFKPTWQGREVHYKDGDFVWTLDESKPISYKYNTKVEEKAWEGRDVPSAGFPTWKYSDSNGNVYMSLTGSIGVQQKIEWGSTETRTYLTYFTEASRTISYTDGTIGIHEVLTHDKAEMLDMRNNTWTECTLEQNADRVNLTHDFAVGKFTGNRFTADTNNSLRATAKVTLAGNSALTGQVELVVGLEPLVLMDFEPRTGVNWNTYITSGKNGGEGDNLTYGQLTDAHIREYGLWMRTATNSGVKFDGSGVVGATVDERVRFGEQAFKLCFDFSPCGETSVAAADGGFSCDLYVNTVQPTKIGMWVNVPADLKGCPYNLKAILAGGARDTAEAHTDGGYNTLQPDGTFTYGNFGDAGAKGKVPKGTTMYTQYYGKSKDAEGNEIILNTLGEMAGKGWLWVEADISAMQMPIDVYRAYTFRVVKTQLMNERFKGHILVDNVQFIYGTNTNDITNPVLESVTETSSGTALAGDGSTVLNSGNLTFNAIYSDSELTDKYATGIDTSGIRVLLDGTDYTGKLEINDGSLYLTGVALRNGTHTLTIRLKDFYGNVTTETRTFRVENTEGVRSAVDIVPQPEAPEIGKEYVFAIVNNTGETVKKAELTVDFSAMGNAAKYLEGAEVKSLSGNYTLTLDQDALKKGLAKITVTKQAAQARRTMLTGVQEADYDYVSELGYLIIKIPANAASDSKLKCTVTQGSYTVTDSNGNETVYTFSGEEKAIPLKADYQLNCKQAIAGMPTELTVTDVNGANVSLANIYQVNSDGTSTKLGSTNMKGTFTKTFDVAGEYTFYAEKNGSGRSWNQRVIVCERTTENGGKPFGILTNGVTVPGTKSITWLTQIDGSDAKAQVKYSNSEDLSGVTPVEGTSSLQTFVQSSHGDALRCNKVTLTGLTPGTTYYYQVGDGRTWSDTQSFKTSVANADTTNFFILGDIQTGNTANLAAALEKLRAGSYDFGVQTGDAIDNVTMYETHCRPFLNTLNSGTLGGVDLIHVLGNHEYYGDADGKISKAIYDLPESAQNSWYKMEYGKVCVVVVNHGTKLSETLTDIAENLTTDCVWKVLVSHEPIYGTESVSATPEILASIEKAGFSFVFGGDDHAYARTYPMLGGVKQVENSRNGVVYFVCGDLSGKSNKFENREYYACAKPHTEYDGMYLTVQATEASFTVKAIKYDGTELDSYTKTRTDCELGKHTVSGTSKYDMTAGTISCAVCGTALKPEDGYAFNGLLSTTDSKQVILANGSVKKNEFSSLGENRYHSCADGYAYLTTQSDSRTCVTGGYITYTCPQCKTTDRSDFQRPVDHKWDENHVCTVCQFHGIDINSEDVVFKFGSPENPRDIEPAPNYYYTGTGVRPGSFAKRGDYVLTQNNDANLINGQIPDLYVEWPDSKNVGKAEIKCTGRGNYYGDKTLTYYIVPNNVTKLALESATEDSLTLTWNAALGAEYYEVYQCDKDNERRTYMGTTAETTITVTGLKEDTEYYFVAAGRTKVPAENNKVYSSAKWSNILCARTSPISADVKAMTATVDSVQIPAVAMDGTNYLFLPASANLASLNAVFTRSAETGDLVVMGDLGSQNVSSTDSLDVSALASETNGYRTITAKVGNGTAFTVRIMQASELPTLYLTSTDTSAQGRSYVDSSKRNTTTAALKMIDANGGEIAATNITELKARGNSTFTYAEKKSYQMKLETVSDLLQNDESVKTWVLLASYFDATLMHDKLFKDMAAALGMPYTASCDWVNLYYDGEYRGVYLLSEKNAVKDTGIDITDLEAAYKEKNPGYGTNMTPATGTNAYGGSYTYTTGLTDPADITGGYLLELNHNAPDEINGFVTLQGKGINVKSPKWCSDEAMKYISEYYQAFENAVYATDETGNYTGINAEGKHYYDYVDRDSLVKIFLLQELALNPDGFVSSLYFYKDADNIMYAGPIWDQDMTLGTGWTKQITPETTDYHYLAKALIQIPDFRDAVIKCYNETFAPQANALIAKNGTIYGYADHLTDSAEMNFVLWPYIRVGDPSNAEHIWQNTTYTSVLADMQSWLAQRIAKLDETFAAPDFATGDVNGDGDVDIFDVYALSRYLAGYEVEGFIPANGDVNGDGDVDIFDAWVLQRRLAGYEN
ncbi:phosphodiester glycosidase family protein [Intestinimonas butyriciproducens]|uniref:Calcineurin-like phosphoesterase family protein n=1 Tax=Intestinimonas butyriciproducens TaxID=1297617 RepID=A0A2U1CCP5_9FIRM|nr:phosphodiester glycosidase family protein [Intestinimonas butyriciproducens]MCR1906009.1 phosphodiester glycosidase family protein [Intestinimonas butyriciproducens]PVY58682.1 calcineurin-like phosphoesterase family protein [Intestinimonas butyriciproducens]QBB65708.1 Exopolysaccharide biosynthesis protein [Intestinimonas butyriciproducens]